MSEPSKKELINIQHKVASLKIGPAEEHPPKIKSSSSKIKEEREDQRNHSTAASSGTEERAKHRSASSSRESSDYSRTGARPKQRSRAKKGRKSSSSDNSVHRPSRSRKKELPSSKKWEASALEKLLEKLDSRRVPKLDKYDDMKRECLEDYLERFEEYCAKTSREAKSFGFKNCKNSLVETLWMRSYH